MAKPVKHQHRADKTAEQEDKFVAEYFAAGGNAALAYSRTFPKSSAASSRSSAAALLTRASVRAKIAAEKRRLRAKASAGGLPVTAERIVRELTAIAFADPGDAFDFAGDGVPTLKPAGQIPPHARRAISALEVTVIPRGKGKPVVKTKVRWHDKGRAAKQLAEILDLFREMSPVVQLEKLLAAMSPADAAAFRQAAADELRRRELERSAEAAQAWAAMPPRLGAVVEPPPVTSPSGGAAGTSPDPWPDPGASPMPENATPPALGEADLGGLFDDP